MALPSCPHCKVKLWIKKRERQEPMGYWAVFECKTIRCPVCKGRCTHVEKAFVETR
jgi:uncharacterized protein YbaR (Trm112 family)